LLPTAEDEQATNNNDEIITTNELFTVRVINGVVRNGDDEVALVDAVDDIIVFETIDASE